ncbi:FAD-binding oxidoreductase [Lacimicrobium alkaliphilum]|uniref:4-cresol dehydrogenase n=1 Tax=Lacimicrobium alkaliphilum TaxID=1526571 RepID=A0ABQ1RNJ3_9ALTE|nr:FAD-binding protein [Lacimicrobium alkaliphilum]GGD75144.1 4-cresol dehydrogenase [Lacimicrobium alkaliphilum]
MTDIYQQLVQAGIISEERILHSEQATSAYGKTTFSQPIHLDAAVKVVNSNEVSKLIKLANTLSFHLYPVSSSKNWGYGSVSDFATDNPKVVLDLSLMNQIYPTDKELGLITIEPGVTQQQLYDYLEQHHWSYMTPVTGAGPNCSIVANALERGYGITPRTDHFEAVTALKAVLPHPELCEQQYHSPISSLDHSDTDFIDKTYKWKLGPYLDGLMTQSNLGVVTQMTIRLGRKPKAFTAFYLRCFDEDNFAPLTQGIRDILRDLEGIVGSINLMDKRRLVSMVADNPNGTAHQVMTDQQVNTLARQNNVPNWLIVGSVYGEPGVVKAAKKVIRSRLKGLGQLLYSDSLLLNIARQVTDRVSIGPLKDIKKQLSSLELGMQIMLGQPNQVALPLAYWRTGKVEPGKSLLPDQDGCGLLWYAPLIPMHSDKMRAFVEFIRTTTPQFGIEPLITFTNLKHDCVDSTIPIVFNLKDSESREQAHQCLSTLVEEGLKQGFVPYRMNIHQQQKLLTKTQQHWQTVDKIKQALDPNNVLSPGRYNP